ncbi:MAG TPA: endonuclease/exonuclease/phosphatase family protein [Candidatus Paceibacterota bacterium]|nr:endonuclease/exonuclease/phosphatase family protein [Candidatus Paceibacterota bacterium]
MTVVSWNVSEKKATLDDIEALIRDVNISHGFVVCLQEVPKDLFPELLEYAKLHGFEVSHGIDKVRMREDGSTRDCYLVVLSQLPIVHSSPWHLSRTSHRPLIARVAIWMLRRLGKWDDTAIVSSGLRIEVDVGNEKPVRILVAHLSLTNPRNRQREFMTATNRVSRLWPTIICGDFNILEGTYGRAVNFLIGGSIPYALWRSERNEFDARLSELKLSNPLAGQETRKGGQLDHIVHTAGLDCIDAKLLPAYGSDHHAIMTTLERI